MGSIKVAVPTGTVTIKNIFENLYLYATDFFWWPDDPPTWARKSGDNRYVFGGKTISSRKNQWKIEKVDGVPDGFTIQSIEYGHHLCAFAGPKYRGGDYRRVFVANKDDVAIPDQQNRFIWRIVAMADGLFHIGNHAFPNEYLQASRHAFEMGTGRNYVF